MYAINCGVRQLSMLTLVATTDTVDEIKRENSAKMNKQNCTGHCIRTTDGHKGDGKCEDKNIPILLSWWTRRRQNNSLNCTRDKNAQHVGTNLLLPQI
ncbi:CLUMA_CG011263, isoform A [Clunio marinus]|uniref:CLUMA_CG011263, isoform A n=1 Tax=Clunio marinus TaxID=568069 RepID=A0A1J1ICD2_9DIPT|nr:CLUMA_CG011263, isoform A [Clunio marinus]